MVVLSIFVVKFNGKDIWEPQHASVIPRMLFNNVSYKGSALCPFIKCIGGSFV